MKTVAIVAAAGRGERLREDVPKALVRLSGTPLIRYVMETIDDCEELEAVVVAGPADRWIDVVEVARASPKLIDVVKGGDSRTASIRNALEAVPDGFEAVVCHDVARPFAPPALFADVLRALAGADGAVPTLPINDTVKRMDGALIGATVSRDGLAVAQTPQAFRRDVLDTAHRKALLEGFEGTDDAALVERAGFRVVAVPGEPSNMKLTAPADLPLAAALAASLRG